MRTREMGVETFARNAKTWVVGERNNRKALMLLNVRKRNVNFLAIFHAPRRKFLIHDRVMFTQRYFCNRIAV